MTAERKVPGTDSGVSSAAVIRDEHGIRIVQCDNARPHVRHGWVGHNEDLRCLGVDPGDTPDALCDECQHPAALHWIGEKCQDCPCERFVPPSNAARSCGERAPGGFGEGCEKPAGHEGYHRARIGCGSSSWPQEKPSAATSSREALCSFFRAYWPHRDTYSGRTMLRRIIEELRRV